LVAILLVAVRSNVFVPAGNIPSVLPSFNTRWKTKYPGEREMTFNDSLLRYASMRLPELNSHRLRPTIVKSPKVAGKVVSGLGIRVAAYCNARSRTLLAVGLLLVLWCPLWAENPCERNAQRALVLSGGGVKGAFEAGAVYHLVVQRGCDFGEFSGVSVGALNAVFLAQAQQASDANESHADLVDQSEALVSLWQSLRNSHDFARNRPLATLRFGLFGLDSLVDFTPLRHLEDHNISPKKLKKGRPVRIGVVSFDDGQYHEILSKSWLSAERKLDFLDYLYASSIPPVFGRLPRIAGNDPANALNQFADGSLRHITPVNSYFVECNTTAPPTRLLAVSEESTIDNCSSAVGTLPAHELVQQLFVIVTSPYSRNSDYLPLADCDCDRNRPGQITDGRKVLNRTLEVMDDSTYRRDLDSLLLKNDLLRWRWHAYQRMLLNVTSEQLMETRQRFLGSGASLESYNRDPRDLGAPSLPYEIGLVAPQKEFADLKNILKFSRNSMQEQLYCGCMAANEMMEAQFGLPSLANRCSERFPRYASMKRNRSTLAMAWSGGTCESPAAGQPDTTVAEE
jgi:predicted acylesterase/phospholipase RssA